MSRIYDTKIVNIFSFDLKFVSKVRYLSVCFSVTADTPAAQLVDATWFFISLNKTLVFFKQNTTHLLRWHVKGERPHVHLLVWVDAGDDEEDAGAAGAAREETAKAEDHRSLVFLHNLQSK